MLLPPAVSSLSLQRAGLLLSDLSSLLPQHLPYPSLPFLLSPASFLPKQDLPLPHHPCFSLLPAVLLPPSASSLALQRAGLLLSDLSFLLPQPPPYPSLPSLLAPASCLPKQALPLPHHPFFSLQPAVLLPPSVSFLALQRAVLLLLSFLFSWPPPCPLLCRLYLSLLLPLLQVALCFACLCARPLLLPALVRLVPVLSLFLLSLLHELCLHLFSGL